MPSLAEKYRPCEFSQLVGQEKAVSALERLDLGGRAFYITGKSGTGKTTMAKIIAMKVAQTSHGISEITGRQLTCGYLSTWRSNFYYRPLFGGYALIVNESHGMHKPVIEMLLDVLEDLPDYATVIFTTTRAGDDLFEEQLDSSPFRSRCFQLALSCRDLTPVFAEHCRAIATKEGLNGKPLDEYTKLLRDCRNNLREALTRIEMGEMV